MSTTFEILPYLHQVYGIKRIGDFFNIVKLCERININLDEIELSDKSSGYHLKKDGKDYIFVNKNIHELDKYETVIHEIGHVVLERIKQENGRQKFNFFYLLLMSEIGPDNDLPEDLESALLERIAKLFPNIKKRTHGRIKKYVRKGIGFGSYMGVVLEELRANHFVDDIMSHAKSAVEETTDVEKLERLYADRLNYNWWKRSDTNINLMKDVAKEALNCSSTIIKLIEIFKICYLQKNKKNTALWREILKSKLIIFRVIVLKVAIKFFVHFSWKIMKSLNPYFSSMMCGFMIRQDIITESIHQGKFKRNKKDG